MVRDLGVPPRTEQVPLLVARIATALWAIPIAHVVETLRPLAFGPADHEIFVGNSVIRGIATPVLDGGTLLGASSVPTRCVVLRFGEERRGVLVDEVVGVRTIAAAALGGYPGLPQTAAGERVRTVDPAFARVLATARLLPELPA